MRNYRLIAAIRYWFKILQCGGIKYIKLVYIMMIEEFQNSPEQPSWLSVKLVLESLGFGHVWIEQGVGDLNMFLRVFKQRLTDNNFLQAWNEEISNSSRANTYELIAKFNFKCYLDVVTVRKFRYAFTRLHVASHRLETKAGRWHKPNRTPVEERKCLFLP